MIHIPLQAVLMILAFVWIHFLSDFVLQSNSMAQNKSKSNYWLGVHVAVYTLPLFYFGWRFALINGVIHGLIDWFTSRFNSKMWAAGRVHAFFVGVGFDQALHYSTLVLSAYYLTL